MKRISSFIPSRPRPPIPAVAIVLALTASPSIDAQTDPKFVCPGLVLEQANCLLDGQNHTYVFGGYCVHVNEGNSSPKTLAYPVEVVVRWKAETKTLREELRMLGGFEWKGQVVGGELETEYVCSGDPVIGQGVCSVISHENGTGLSALSIPAQAFQPITQGKVTLAEAAKLSAKPSCSSSSSSPPPPPPAPEKKPALKTPKKSTSSLPAPSGAAPVPSAVATPEGSGAPHTEPRTRPARRVLVPDPTHSPARARPQKNPGPPNFPCAGPLLLRAGERILIGEGTKVEGLQARGRAPATRLRINEPGAGGQREVDADEVCIDSEGLVYTLDSGQPELLGRPQR